MKIAARILAGLLGLFMFYNAFNYMFMPEAVLGLTKITPDNLFGLNNIRANIGASSMTFAVLLLISAIMARKDALLAVIIFACLFILARISGLILDGFDTFSIRATVLGVVILIISSSSYFLFARSEKAASATA